MRLPIKRIRKLLVRRQLAGHTRLHLACGPHLLDGWANIDLLGSRQVNAWNLNDGLPVPDHSIEYIFCEHFIEHITRPQAVRLLRECRRVLRTGGVIRLSTPDLRKVVNEYLAANTGEWHDVEWYPASPCCMLNEAMRMWGHRFVYDKDELIKVFNEAGFGQIEFPAWRQSRHPALAGLETRPYHGELIVEAGGGGRGRRA